MGRVLIQGASRGIGRALAEQCHARGDEVWATARHVDHIDLLGVRRLVLDVEDEGSIEAAAAAVDAPLDLVVNASGLLHDGALQPEKRLGHLDPDHLARLFAVNATGPALVAKHLAPRLAPSGVLACLSARVGSIGDNGLGGWYGYRASKAALNMFVKCLSVELARRSPGIAVVALHPGTVATDLSAPFRRRAPNVFPVERAAEQLLSIVDALTGADTGRFIAWDGSDIPW
ncbi:MAG: SDR family NAD(P)-dependent oxidoreductase [Myxococcales bacterium]|nr:SDR family NAD(P)-dependent oxidoreductase [Myxococcales bacterium]